MCRSTGPCATMSAPTFACWSNGSCASTGIHRTSKKERRRPCWNRRLCCRRGGLRTDTVGWSRRSPVVPIRHDEVHQVIELLVTDLLLPELRHLPEPVPHLELHREARQR